MNQKEVTDMKRLTALVNNGALSLSPGKLFEMMENGTYNEEFENYINSIVFQIASIVKQNFSGKVEMPEKMLPINYKPL